MFQTTYILSKIIIKFEVTKVYTKNSIPLLNFSDCCGTFKKSKNLKSL